MNNAKSDCEQLLGVVMPFAERLLNEHGEFYPFGATMSQSGECTMAAAYVEDEDDRPKSAPLIDLMEARFRNGAQSGEYKATAIVYDALTVPPDKDEKQDTVICALDHHDNYSIKVCFPYTIVDGELNLEDPFAVEGEHNVFSEK